MAVPVDCFWDEEVHGPRTVWSIDSGDPGIFDSMPLTDTSPDITNPADALKSVAAPHASMHRADHLLIISSVMQSIKPREDQNSWFSSLVVPPSTLKIVPLESYLKTRNLGRDTTMSLKERV
jgi:hypothetical protein